ncbi:hypothetical protein V8F33_010809 [Rhypophila sp. PSN 637]
MLRRHSSIKSKSDLSRRKSTSSVHGVHLEHIDPAVAHRDAHAAASQAFSRAQARERIEMPVFPPTPQTSPRRRHYTSDGTRGSDGGTPTGITVDGSPQQLRHRHSVRLVGPRASHGLRYRASETASARRFKDEDVISATQSELVGNQNTRQRLEVSSAPRRAPPPPPVPLPGIASEHLLNLVREEKYYTPEDDVASVPSSFRRLRRSRSLFTSDDVGHKGSQGAYLASLTGRAYQASRAGPASSVYKAAFSDHDGRHPSYDIPRLKAPRSMGFLRVRGRRSGSVTTQGTQDDDIQSTSANGQLTHRLGDVSRDSTRLVPKPSFFSSRGHHTETVIRKSLRSDGSTNDAEAKSDDSPAAPLSFNKEDRFKVKARKVSKSLKAKLKNLFNLSKSEDEPPSFPPQHITAQRTHVREDLLSPPPSHNDHDGGSEIGCSSIHRVTSGVPSLQMIPPNVLRSNRVSLESLKVGNERKVSDDKSLTTWAASGPSTLTSQQRMEWWEELERQRLSTIMENGAHTHNSSLRRQALGPHILHTDDDPFGNPVPSGRFADNQRLYSALMKRADDHNKQVGIGGNQQGNVSGGFPRPTDTIYSVEALLRGSMKAGSGENTVQPSFQRSFSPLDPSPSARVSRNGSLGHIRSTADAGQFRTGSPSPMSKFTRYQGLEGGKFAFNSTAGSSPGVNRFNPVDDDQMSKNGHHDQESSSPPPQEPDSSSTPTSHLFRTKPPYRQSLRRSIEAEELLRTQRTSSPFAGTTAEGDSSYNTNNAGSDGFCSNGADPVNDTQYSESVYSTDDCHQDDGDQSSNGTYRRLRMPDSVNNDVHGPMDSPLAYRPVGCGGTSSASSIDWKTWLSANVDQFESSPTPPMPSEIEYALPTMPTSFQPGHVREYAQIHDEDEDGKAYEPQTHTPKLPMSPLATVEPNVVRVSPMQRSVKRASPSSGGKTLVENDSPHRTPSAAVKSSLRVVPSALERTRADMDYSLPSSVASSPGFTMALQRQFGAGPKY